MNGTCSQERCHLDSGCILGEIEPSKCKHWSPTSDSNASPDVASATLVRASLPWNGGAFGLDDISLISGRDRPSLIALIGPHNAGKTTYLAALHLLCLRQQINPDVCFCGSMTLGGWERIADFMRYPKECDPCYPPHTPIPIDRTPGMLHYAFRGSDESVQHMLFTDAPGEWFTDWSIDPDPAQTPGATWTIRNADAFLFFIDREALGGINKGVSRHRIKTLAARLSEHLNSRPIGIVWSKSDVAIQPEIHSAITDVINRCFPGATQFHTRFKPVGDDAKNMIDPLVASFQFVSRPRKIMNPFEVNLKPQVTYDAFLSYRGTSYGK